MVRLHRRLMVDLLAALEPERSGDIRAFLHENADEDLDRRAFGRRLAREVGLPLSVVARVQVEIDRLVASVSDRGPTLPPDDPVSPPGEAPPDGTRYTGFRAVGHGGMGIVRSARDAWLDRAVAVKMARDRSPARQNQLLREARLTGSLEHPGVVPVHDLGMTRDGEPYYVMRYVEGGRTLLDAIGECATLDERIALLEPFLQVCDTIRFAHSRGVLHLDLKPANVALGQFGEVLVLDWGLAVELDEVREAPRPAAGTPGYMAPEVALGTHRGPSVRTDVYSLGATLHHVLAGTPPFPETTLADLRDRLRRPGGSAPTELPLETPRALAGICGKAIAASPEDRHVSVDEITGEIRTWLRARARDREFEQHLLLAEASFTDARDAPPAARALPLDRAAAACEKAVALRPSGERTHDLRERIDTLREETARSLARAERHRLLRTTGLALGAVLLLTAVVTTVVVIGARDREARQRARADDLSRFMLTDLNARLAPLGRLDLLHSVARRALASLRADEWRGTDPGRDLQEATAMYQIANVLSASGETERALGVYLDALDMRRRHLADAPDGHGRPRFTCGRRSKLSPPSPPRRPAGAIGAGFGSSCCGASARSSRASDGSRRPRRRSFRPSRSARVALARRGWMCGGRRAWRTPGTPCPTCGRAGASANARWRWRGRVSRACSSSPAETPPTPRGCPTWPRATCGWRICSGRAVTTTPVWPNCVSPARRSIASSRSIRPRGPGRADSPRRKSSWRGSACGRVRVKRR